MLSASGHKIHGPKGIGILYVRKGVKISSFIHGGAQERKRRAGTHNVPGIVGMGKAASLAEERMGKTMAQETELLAVELRELLKAGQAFKSLTDNATHNA